MSIKRYIFIEEGAGGVDASYDERDDKIEVSYKYHGVYKFTSMNLDIAKSLVAVLQKIINQQEAEDAGV